MKSSFDLGSVLAVATATLDSAGVLRDANEGFLRLVGSRSGIGRVASPQLLQPGFAELGAATPDASGLVHDGLLTVADDQNRTRTLHAKVWRDGDRFHFLAEYDVVGLERLSDTVLELNRDYARAQHELAQAQLSLQRINSELERRVQERTAALAVAKREAEDANRAKNVFLDTVSHEFRAPLNTIVSFSTLLAQSLAGTANGNQLRQLALVRDAGRQLMDLVQDALDVTGIETGNLPLRMAAVDPGSLVEEECAICRPHAVDRGLEFTVAAERPLRVLADPARVRQVVRNLVSNAIKFTDAGRVSVRVASDGGMARVVVSDTGVGMPPALVSSLFEPFHHVSGSSEQLRPGLGLGLAISNHLVSAMGGKLEVTSEVGKGSTFWFTLPLAA
jgi:signal transduction histidine kinase